MADAWRITLNLLRAVGEQSMFKVGDRVIDIRRGTPAEVVKLVPLSSGRTGFACQWQAGDKMRISFFRADELRGAEAHQT